MIIFGLAHGCSCGTGCGYISSVKSMYLPSESSSKVWNRSFVLLLILLMS
jgi:hypothetical protein